MAKIVSHARVGLILTPINVDGRLFVVVSGQRLFVIVMSIVVLYLLWVVLCLRIEYFDNFILFISFSPMKFF